MARIAFLRILVTEGITPNTEEIHQYLLNPDEGDNLTRFDEVRPFEVYTPNGYDHRFVVWRYNRDDKVSDEEVLGLVGEDGNVFYLWHCPKCKQVVRRAEHPENPSENIYFGCQCPGTVFYGMTEW